MRSADSLDRCKALTGLFVAINGESDTDVSRVMLGLYGCDPHAGFYCERDECRGMNWGACPHEQASYRHRYADPQWTQPYNGVPGERHGSQWLTEEVIEAWQASPAGRFAPLHVRFARKVDTHGAMHSHLGTRCWLWLGATTKGYGTIADGPAASPRRMYAHRLAKLLDMGDWPDASLFVCHHCDNPLCVNPRHLYLGTVERNTRDARDRGLLRHWNRDKPACKHGHAFTPENTYHTPRGKRQCKQCGREKSLRQYHARQAKGDTQ